MRFAVLGRLEAYREGEPVVLTGPKQRLLLGVLISRAGRPVTGDELVDLLWQADPPTAARKALAWHVLKLREALGGRDRIRFGSGGYLLDAASADIDAALFRRLVREAAALSAGDPAGAEARLQQGLALWRGDAYGDLSDAPALRREARELEELRLGALEAHGDNGLRLGHHARLVPELTALTAGHPHREGFRAQLMLALYRCGRGAEALAVYRDGHRLVTAELGVEPGQRLRTLQRRILAGDPGLDHEGGPVTGGSAPAAPVVPRQLPADSASFTGRDAEVAALLAAIGGERRSPAVLIGAIDGMAGIGKTTLAVHVAHRLADRFPDGQLFIDLHGYSGNVAPVAPADALARLLRALGVSDAEIPEHLDDRSALLRTILADRRVLLVLDNTATEAQVRPLLPSGPRPLALITSRRRLSGIDDVVAVDLGVLDAKRGAELFLRVSGAELAPAQHEDVDRIVALCGGLPLAIRLAAHRLRGKPSWSPARLLERLRREDRGLGALSVGERSVAAAFRLSYRELEPALRRTFRLLSRYPGTGFSAHTAAALAGLGLDTAETHLDELADAQLLQARGAGRFGFHDLMRRYAAEESAASDTPQDRAASLRRLLEAQRYTAFQASVLVDAERRLMPDPPSAPASPVPVFADAAAGLRWFDAEAAVLGDFVTAAIDHGLYIQACQLAHAADALANVRGRLSLRVSLNESALTAARRHGDPDVLARGLNNAANAYRSVSRSAEAIRCYDEAIEIWRAAGDVRGQAAIHNNLGITQLRLGRLAESSAAYETAIELARGTGDASLEAKVITNYATTLQRLERYDRVLELLDRAHAIAVRLGDARHLANVNNGLGNALRGLGEPGRAHEHHRSALEYYEHAGDSLNQCDTHNAIAAALRSLGRVPDAMRHHRRALDAIDGVGDANRTAQSLNNFGRSLLSAGQVGAAIDSFGAARDSAEATDDRYEAARAAHGLARALLARGDRDGARPLLATAVADYTAMGVPAAERAEALLED